MIIGIGCDIVEHKVSKDLDWPNNKQIQERIFSAKELEIYASKKQLKFLSGRFAAKEAVLKCLSKGMEDGISLTDIEILQLIDGAPFVSLSGNTMELSKTMGIRKWHVTISHSLNFSHAFVIAED